MHYKALIARIKSNFKRLADKPFLKNLKPFLPALLCLAVWLVSSYIFYRRFPGNYDHPNFYAEDGDIFVKNIINHGFWHAIATTFDGYYVLGIYILDKIGFIINNLFYDGHFINIPRSFALVSYAYLGLMATMPLILFKRHIRIPALLVIALLVTYVPMSGFNYGNITTMAGIMGVIGNLKFTFLYLAFLLLCYRHLIPEKSKKVFLVDAALLICAYTNITVYLILPFAALRYLPQLTRRRFWPDLKNILRSNRSAQSLIALTFLLIPQLYVLLVKGVPVIPGYLAEGFDYRRTIEIFISRSYLYDVLFPINRYLNDVFVVMIFLLLIGAAWRYARRYRQFFIFGMLTIFLGTFLFVVKRTGIGIFYTGYKDSGPDQFFYTQSWIFSFVFVLVATDILGRIKRPSVKKTSYIVATICAIFLISPYSHSYSSSTPIPTTLGYPDASNTVMATTVGDIYENAKKVCTDNKGDVLDLPIYPREGWYYHGATRQQLCSPTTVNDEP